MSNLSRDLSSFKSLFEEKVQFITPTTNKTSIFESASVPTNQTKTKPALSPRSSSDRMFNVVVYGVAESTKGTVKNSRKNEDINKIEEVLSSINSQVGMNSIRDCICLGKYNHMASRPRPMLVNLNRVTDVHNIQSSVRSLSKPYDIKPDLPYEKR